MQNDIKKTIALSIAAYLGLQNRWGLVGQCQDLPSASDLLDRPGRHEGERRFLSPEPGRGMLRVQVRNIDVLTASLKSAGFSVITTGGAPVTLPQGPRVIILRDPNNFYWQLMEAR